MGEHRAFAIARVGHHRTPHNGRVLKKVMGDSKNIASLVKDLKSFDGRSSYREWVLDTLIMVSLTHREIYQVMQGALRPGALAAASTATPALPVFCVVNTDPAGQIQRWENPCENLYNILHLITAGLIKLSRMNNRRGLAPAPCSN